jgi:hypothetical protein
MQQVVVNAQMLLLLLLLGAVIYGVMVSNRVSRSHSSLTGIATELGFPCTSSTPSFHPLTGPCQRWASDSNASLPPATAKLVRHLADEELGESLAQMEENIGEWNIVVYP